MQPWSHLPNASRIDQVLAHVKANPKEWDAAWIAARVAAWDAASDAASGAAWIAARDAAWIAVLTLVAWDHSGSLLDLPSDQVLMLAKLGQPAAILMYPAVLVMSDNG